ncbi:hypothetical protein GPALN_009789 [Globodera pallida]|nr:hypothetical protein GPALN_009789 [Globodera pallida]
MSITKSTGRTPNLDKLNPIQLIRMLFSQSLITLNKLNPIQLIRILLSQSLITPDKLNPIQLIRIFLSQRANYSDDEKLEIVKKLMQMESAHSGGNENLAIPDKKPKIRDEDIAKMLKIGSRSLYTWKRKFQPHQLHSNSVDGLSVEDNAEANV